MSKSEILVRMNAEHLAKIAYFDRQSPERQRELSEDRSFWSAHDCRAYTHQGVCLECGQTSIRLAV